MMPIFILLKAKYATVIITKKYCVFLYCMLFSFLPGATAVVSSFGAAVLSSVATQNNRDNKYQSGY